MTRIIAFSILFAAMTTAAFAIEYRCDTKEKHVCESGSGCRSIPPSTWNLIDAEKLTYSRCDRRGCDHYDAEFRASGAFINIDVRGRGLIAKMAVDGSSFVEVATLKTQG